MNIKYFGHPEDKPLRSSMNDMKVFMEHNCWLDIVDWIVESIDYHKDQLLNAEDMETVRYHQAAVVQLENLKELPNLFVEELEAIKNQEQQDKNNE